MSFTQTATTTIALVGLLVTFACGNKQDECQKAYAKLAPIMEEMTGKKLGDADRAKGVDECRAGKGGKNDAVMKCVLDATGDDAIKHCLVGAMTSYLTRSKKTEAPLRLNQLAKNAKEVYIETSGFVEGTSQTLPAASCCSAPDHKCTVTTAWASDPVWKALDFQIDTPNLFQYTYKGTKTEATITAVGDLDCDGKSITYTMRLTAPGGHPTGKLEEPEPDAQ